MKSDNKRMDYEAYKIVVNGGIVEVYGNKFNFKDPCINGEKTGFSGVYTENDTMFRLPASDGIHINYYNKNNHLIGWNPENCTTINIKNINSSAWVAINGVKYYGFKEISLNSDFSVQKVVLGSKNSVVDINKIDKKNSKEIFDSLDKENNIIVYTNNFYDFDKNKNIVGLKQKVTYRVKLNYKSEFLDELIKENEEKYNYEAVDLFRKIKEILTQTKKEIFKPRGRYITFEKYIDITFTDNYKNAYVSYTLARNSDEGRKKALFFFKKDEEQNKYILDKKNVIPFECGNMFGKDPVEFTVFKDRVIFIYHDNDQLKKITMVNANDSQIKTEIRNVDGSYLSRLNLKNCVSKCSFKELQEKLSVYFDKHAENKKGEEDKNIELMEFLKKKEEEKKEQKKKKKNTFFSLFGNNKKVNKNDDVINNYEDFMKYDRPIFDSKEEKGKIDTYNIKNNVSDDLDNKKGFFSSLDDEKNEEPTIHGDFLYFEKNKKKKDQKEDEKEDLKEKNKKKEDLKEDKKKNNEEKMKKYRKEEENLFQSVEGIDETDFEKKLEEEDLEEDEKEEKDIKKNVKSSLKEGSNKGKGNNFE